MRLRRLAVMAGAAVLAAAAAAFAAAWRPGIAAIAPPPRSAFAAADVARGAGLAAVGDCAVCHSSGFGRAYAGGRAIPTPFGTVHSTNITPDPETGIGRWSEAAFRRAMRDGVARDGRHLYPVLPYPHFTRATDDDIAALYAFLMTRAPVQAAAPPNQLPFPLNVRATLAGWNLLFLRPGPWRPDPAQPAEWNRGAYLVEAVGHCGACHSPRNLLGAERNGAALQGGEAEGWEAHALTAGSPAREPWTVDELAAYLRTGLGERHGFAAGPMRAVSQGLSAVPDSDLRAIATYVAAGMAGGQPRQAAAQPVAQQATQAAQPAPQRGVPRNALFEGACAACHADDAPMVRGGAPSLALSTTVNAPTPRNAVAVVLQGIPWQEGRAGAFMPGFADGLSDAQVADIVRYVRARYSDRPAWEDVEAAVRAARSGDRSEGHP